MTLLMIWLIIESWNLLHCIALVGSKKLHTYTNKILFIVRICIALQKMPKLFHSIKLSINILISC